MNDPTKQRAAKLSHTRKYRGGTISGDSAEAVDEGIAQLSPPMPPQDDKEAFQAFLERIIGIAVFMKYDAEAFAIDSVYVGVAPIKKGDELTEPGALFEEMLATVDHGTHRADPKLRGDVFR